MIDFIKGLKPRLKYILLPYICLVIFHIFFIKIISAPWIVPDEFINLAHARYFAGLPSAYFLQSAYNHFLYGFFISPAFVIFDSPFLAYKFIALLNAVYLSSLYIIFFLILKKIFRQSDKQALIISLLINLIPGIFSRSFFAVSENLLIPLFYLALLCFYLFIEKMTYWRASWFSLVVLLLYATHYRAVVVLVITISYFLVLYIFRRNKTIIFSVILMILGTLSISSINNHLMDTSWLQPIKYSLKPLLKDLFIPGNLLLLVSTIFGQFLYLFLASFGFVITGIMYCFSKVKCFLMNRGAKSTKDHLVMYFSILVLGIFFSSTLIIIAGALGGDIRFDFLVYGRYNEIFLPLLLALGLIQWRKPKRFFSVFWFFIFIIMFFLFYLVGSHYLRHYNYAVINITSFALVAITKSPWPSLLFVTLTSILLMYLFYKLRCLEYKVLLLAILFLLNPGFYFMGPGISLYKNNSFTQYILPKIEAGGADRIIYDLPHVYASEKGRYDQVNSYWRVNYFVLQYSLPRIQVLPTSVLEQNIEAPMVITNCQWINDGYHILEKIIIDQANPDGDFNCMALYAKNSS